MSGQQNVPLPKLPGMSFDNPKSWAKTRPQTLTYINGYAVPDERKIVAGLPEARPFPPATNAAPYAGNPMEEGTGLPPWVAYDRKVLRFNGYFKEAVTEMHEENFRIRKCVVYFYLEDGSIHVAEPKQANSGIPQGVFLKRHRIPKDDGSAFSVEDLNVGKDVTFYSRVFHLNSCDPFTRNFLAKSGIEVPEEETVPEEPISVYRDSLKKVKHGRPKPQNDDLTRFMEAKLGKASNTLCADKLKKFVENDRKVLRFFCVWDDRAALCGERRPYVLHYFLADDTVEILEVNEPNSGRDPFPVFVKRGPLPNQKIEVDALGPTKSYTHYTAKDLGIGKTVMVYNREFFVHDADDFTRAFYIENLGLSEEDMMPIDITENPDPIPQMELPPYNGFGSQYDTIQNCISLIPKAAKKDFHKMMNNEKKVLRFTAILNSDAKHTLSHADIDRKFVISFFLADDTMAIFEPPIRNSGIIGGKFLERSEVLKPNGVSPYVAADLFVGSKIEIFKRLFELVEADDYTYAYMEAHEGEFPASDFTKVIGSVRGFLGGSKDVETQLRLAFIEMDADGSGFLSREELGEALSKAGISLSVQSIITIHRKYDTSGDGKISINELFNAFGLTFEE